MRTKNPDMSTETEAKPSRKLIKIPVDKRTLMQKLNRHLRRNGRIVLRSRSYGEKRIGKFILIDNGVIMEGWSENSYLENFAREEGCLAAYEYIAD